jgi:hypothetical protein
MTKMNLTMCLVLATTGSGCGIFKMLGGGLGGGSSAFTANMDKYDVQSIDLEIADSPTHFCPGTTTQFTIVAQATKKKGGAKETLRTAAATATGAEVRGKVDLAEFAMEARGGSVERGVFSTSGDTWSTLLGFDLRATYREDKTKVVEKHFDPIYSCITAAGSSGLQGAEGEGGAWADSAGGAGGFAGGGGMGGTGPRLVAYATIVQTPKYERVGLLKVGGDVEQLTLFDLATGITVYANGGQGGWGGRGGDGGAGADPQGAGGPGGSGGQGGPGGDGGEILVVLDDRYNTELGQSVRVDVSGGLPGPGGYGGNGGAGGAAPEKACDDCEQPEPGPDGPGGPGGPDGTIAGRDGRFEVRIDNTDAVFGSLPPGIALRDDPHPQAAAPPPPAPKPGKNKRRR